MKHFNANGMTMSQILGLRKPTKKDIDQDKADALYKKREARLREMQGGQELFTRRSFDAAQDDGEMGEEVQGKADLSIPAQVNTSFVPYITSVGKQCLQPMAYGIKLITVLIFICCLFNNEALAQSHENGGAVTEHTLQIPEGGIVIGDSLPESFWKQELQVVNHPRGRKSIRLSSYKHQLLVLDFLNTACVPCIASVDKWNQLQHDFRLEVTVLPIHLYGDNSRIAAFATEKKWEMPIAVGNAADTLINQLFYAHKSFGQVWIKDGKLLAIPHNRDVSVSLVEKALNGKPLDIQMNDMMTYFDRRYFDVEQKED